MKNILLSTLAIGSICFGAGATARAAQNDDVLARVAALEKENAAIRKENQLLRENKALRQQNAALRPAPPSQPLRAELPPQPAQVELEPAIKPVSKPDPFGAYAADLPLAYKTPAVEPGRFRMWAEGGAIWSGGDPISQTFNLIDFTGFVGPFGGTGTDLPGVFNLTPKLGWEAATGFDYRFAGSPWHVSGQFRYGEGQSNGLASSAGAADLLVIRVLGLGALSPGTTASGNETFAASYKETHWVADLAVGRDVLGNGPDAMQVKAGLRVSEFVGTTRLSTSLNSLVNFSPPALLAPGTPLVSAVAVAFSDLTEQRSSFLGAGPRLGIEGSVPFAGSWAFDYLGDAAVLFGNQKLVRIDTNTATISPAFLALVFGGANNSVETTTDQRFATVFNADIQAGFSYWVTQNFKVSASYRLDAFFNVLNQTFSKTTSQTTDRYIHGPRVTVTAQF